MAKIFEKLLLQQVNLYLANNKLQSPIQFGYRKGYSTQDALLFATESWRASLDARRNTHVAFLDLSKAFDSMNHTILGNKLSQLGFGDQSRNILMQFVSNRLQRVNVNGESSDWILLTRGVPQGTVLGPVLFSLYLNDIARCLPRGCKIVQYADDTCIFVSCKTDTEAKRLLTSALECILQYFQCHELTLNVNKTEYLVIEPKRSNSTHVINAGGTAIQSKFSCKYLGIVIDHHLSFKEQVNKTLSNMAMGIKTILLLRNQLPVSSRLELLNSLVISHLQYPMYMLSSLTDQNLNRLNRQLNWGLRCCYDVCRREHITKYRLKSGVLPVELQMNYAMTIKFWLIINGHSHAFRELDFPNLPSVCIIEQTP